MFIDEIQTGDLNFPSYVVGDGVQAAAINPPSDINACIQAARLRGAQITHVVLTASDKGLKVSAARLAAATSSRLIAGPLHTGWTPPEDERFTLGGMTLVVRATNGADPNGLTIVVLDAEFSEELAVIGDRSMPGTAEAPWTMPLLSSHRSPIRTVPGVP
ncbi:hypothetical protein ACXYTJ_02395 [Gilvimarinus sp. F26214L]|uniref:hypothetical protein n=1 Tax=Gilvimarinus sp. DZF01 TaxID=3461371 RepID=UPI004045F691